MPLPNPRREAVSLPPPKPAPAAKKGRNPRVNVVFRADAFEVEGDEIVLFDGGAELLRVPRRAVGESGLVRREW